jgi:hypothetical protein
MKLDSEILCESYPCTRARHENTNSKSIATRFFRNKRLTVRPLAHAYCQDCFDALFGSERSPASFEELTYEEYLVHGVMLT